MSLSTQDFELLLQANRVLSSKLDVKDVLQAVMELATQVVKAEASSLLLLDERTNELYFDVALGSAKESVKQIRLKVGEGIAGWVAKQKQPIIVNDVAKDSRFTGKVDKASNFKTKSLLAVPLLAKGRLIGVVEAINKKNNQGFSETDKEAFEIFASQSAIAIENARLFSAMMREKEKLNTVFAEMSDGIALLDEGGAVLLLNQAGARLLALAPEQAAGRSFGSGLFGGFDEFPSSTDLKNIQGKTAAFELTRKKGKDLYVSALVHRLEEGAGSPGGYLMMLHDTTEEKREERLKRNFLALVSHKLRTPLTVIVGYAPALVSTSQGLSAFQTKALKAIADQGEHLSGLVEKLLRFTTVESENLKLKRAPSSLSPLIKDAVESFEPLPADKKITITIDPSVATLPTVKIDNAHMVEVFKNLVDNAIKFNDKPERKIKISGGKEGKYVLVHIEDNGVGIPTEEFEKIFQKFYQIENSFTGQVPGAGLGLALCRRVVSEMDGTISVKSVIGKGSTFTLRLPCR
jgi:PAS domain S-box-containing protein